MADVIARQMLYALFGMWQMLLPRGRWLSSFVFLADVIANGMWQMFYHYSVLQPLADVIAKWQME